MKITLLYGGQSAEHDISIISAHSICQAIMYNYYQVQPIYITKTGQWLKAPLLEGPSTSPEQLTLTAGDTAHWASVPGEVSSGVVINPGEIKVEGEETIVFPVLHGPNG